MKRTFFKSSLLTLVSGVLIMASGCQTGDGIFLKEQPYSLNEIRRAIGIISGKPRKVSDNQREILTAYFSRKPTEGFDPNTAKERLYVHFWILGERRPYDIRVIVMSEARSGGEYTEVGEDINMSKKISNELNEKLVQSQDGSNIIDSFRPF